MDRRTRFMAPSDPPKSKNRRKSRYTEDRGMSGAFEGETVTRRTAITIGGQAAGGIAAAAFLLPAVGFALGPMLEDSTPDTWQDVGPERDFNDQFYVPRVMNIVASIGEAGKTTVYMRRFNPKRDSLSPSDEENDKKPQPYVAISTRCAHLGCPVRYIQASQRFVCPCHGGVYDFEGKVAGGPPVRPLDRFYTRVRKGRVEVGDRFSVNSELRRFSPRDPSNHLDGIWQYLYPSRPST
jgi:quinol---cytochrome c reductase iron-sulfur subunit, bacillus type